jgi:hypothetical protein
VAALNGLQLEIDGSEARLYADVPTRQAQSIEKGWILAIRLAPENVQTF